MYALKPLLVLSATLSLTLAKPLPSDEELPAYNLRGGVITPKPTQQNDMVYSVILNVPSMARVQDVKNGEPVKGSWQLIGPEKKTIQFKDASDPNPFIRQEVLLTTYLDTKDEDWKKIKADQEDKTKKKKRPFPKKSVRRTVSTALSLVEGNAESSPVLHRSAQLVSRTDFSRYLDELAVYCRPQGRPGRFQSCVHSSLERQMGTLAWFETIPRSSYNRRQGRELRKGGGGSQQAGSEICTNVRR